MKFSSILKKERQRQGWSQATLANHLGTTANRISVWERGLESPSPYFRKQLSQVFAKSIAELGLLDEPSPQSFSVQGSAEMMPIWDPMIPSTGRIGLIGRTSTIGQIIASLTEMKQVALWGLPGVGKTALAVGMLAQQAILEQFPDGVLWAGLGPHPSIEEQLDRWNMLLESPSAPVRGGISLKSRQYQLLLALRTRRILLVIDDVWKPEDALALKLGGAHCGYLFTTRFPHIADTITEQDCLHIEEMNPHESLVLLSQFVPSLVARKGNTTQSLVSLAAGLPLALVVMGSYLRQQEHSQQPRRVAQAIEHLQQAEFRLHLDLPSTWKDRPPTLEQHMSWSLQSIIEMSDRSLDPRVRAAFYALSVFPPKPISFSEEAARAVMDEPLEMLDRLCDTGLLEETGGGRYFLHQSIASYAHQCLADNAYTPQLRLLAYCQEYVERHAHEEQALFEELPLILTALDAAFSLEQTSPLVKIASRIAPLLVSHGLYQQGLFHLQRVYETARRQGQPEDVFRILLALCEITFRQDDYAQALRYVDDGITLTQKGENPQQRGAFLVYFGAISQQKGEKQRAKDAYHEALDLARTYQDQYTMGQVLCSLASLIGQQGQLSQAQQLLIEGLFITRQTRDFWQMVAILTNLGIVARQCGDHRQAQSYYEEGLAVSLRQGYLERADVLRINLGALAHYHGDYAGATVYYQDALTGLSVMGQQERICQILVNLAAALLAQYKHTEAKTVLQQALELATRMNHVRISSQVLGNLGTVAYREGDITIARDYYRQAATLARQFQNPKILAEILLDTADFLLATEQEQEAEAIFEEVTTLLHEGQQELLAQAHYGQARLLARRGQYQQAQQTGMDVLDTLLSLHYYALAKKVWAWLVVLPPQTMTSTAVISRHGAVRYPACPLCGEQQHIVKRGKNRGGSQRYTCSSCKRSFTEVET